MGVREKRVVRGKGGEEVEGWLHEEEKVLSKVGARGEEGMGAGGGIVGGFEGGSIKAAKGMGQHDNGKLLNGGSIDGEAIFDGRSDGHGIMVNKIDKDIL